MPFDLWRGYLPRQISGHETCIGVWSKGRRAACLRRYRLADTQYIWEARGI